MCTITQLVLAALNPIPIEEHLRGANHTVGTVTDKVHE